MVIILLRHRRAYAGMPQTANEPYDRTGTPAVAG